MLRKEAVPDAIWRCCAGDALPLAARNGMMVAPIRPLPMPFHTTPELKTVLAEIRAFIANSLIKYVRNRTLPPSSWSDASDEAKLLALEI